MAVIKTELQLNQETQDGTLAIEMRVPLQPLFEGFLQTFRQHYGPCPATLDVAVGQTEDFLRALKDMRRGLRRHVAARA